MSRVSLATTLEAILIDPHPELVAIQRPTPRQVCEAASLMGWLCYDEDRFRPAVIGGT